MNVDESRPSWELVVLELDNRVRRLAVPGGWLYQVEQWQRYTDSVNGPAWGAGWGTAVFVPVETIRFISRSNNP